MRRSAAAAALAVTLAALGAGLAAPPAAEAAMPLPPIGDVLGGGNNDKPKDKGALSDPDCQSGVRLGCAVEQVTGGALGTVQGVAGAGAQVAGNAVLGGLAAWPAEAAGWLVREIGVQVSRSTHPAIASPWYRRHYNRMLAIAIALSAFFFLAAVVHAVVRRDGEMMGRSVLFALPVAMILSFTALTFVEIALDVTDWMTAAVLEGFDRNVVKAFSDLSELILQPASFGTPLPSFLMFLIAVVTAVLAIVVWLELVMREAAIYVTAAFLPLTLMAMVWERTAHWPRKLAGWLAAIILAKFTIASAFAIAAGALGNATSQGSGSGGVTALLAGCGILFVAALTPWALLALVPLVEESVGRGLHRRTVGSAQAATPGSGTANMAVRQMMVRSFGPAGMAAGAGQTMTRGASTLAGNATGRPPSTSPLTGGSGSGPGGGATKTATRSTTRGERDGER